MCCPFPMNTACVAVTRGFGLSAVAWATRRQSRRLGSQKFPPPPPPDSRSSVLTRVERHAEDEALRFYRMLIHGAFVPRRVHGSRVLLGERSERNEPTKNKASLRASTYDRRSIEKRLLSIVSIALRIFDTYGSLLVSSFC